MMGRKIAELHSINLLNEAHELGSCLLGQNV